MKGRWIAAVLLALAAASGAQAQDYPHEDGDGDCAVCAGRTGRHYGPYRGRHLFPAISASSLWSRTLVAPAAPSAPFAPPARRPMAYTIISGHMGTHAAAPAFYPNLGYDPEKDFEPIGLIAEQPELLAVRKDFPANNLQEFVAYAKANENKLNMGHAGSDRCPTSVVFF